MAPLAPSKHTRDRYLRQAFLLCSKSIWFHLELVERCLKEVRKIGKLSMTTAISDPPRSAQIQTMDVTKGHGMEEREVRGAEERR